MSVEDIQPVDMVILRNGCSCIVTETQIKKIYMLYNPDLTSKLGECYDIVEIRRPNFQPVYVSEKSKVKTLTRG